MASDKQIILITGASSGIGLDTAYYLTASSPNNHVIMGVRNPEKGQKALSQIQSRKPQGTLSLLTLDISNDASIHAAAQTLEADYARIDVLINNAGNQIQTQFPTRAQLRESFETNVFGTTILTQTLIPLITASKSKKIINVSSELGSISARLDPTNRTYHNPMAAYRMSKAALNMFTACLHHDFKAHGVKVWSFCPGFVVTNLAGPGAKERRAAMGAASSETSAQGILEIVQGKRDAEVGTFVARYGERLSW